MDSIWKEAEKNIVFHASKLNIIESCVDRHAKSNPGKTAFVFETNGRRDEFKYGQLLEEVNRFSNLLKKLRLRKNSRVFMFLPKIPEMYISILGTIKQGSIAAPLFEAFQQEGLELRLKRGQAHVLVTNKELFSRVPKNIKKIVPSLKHILIVDSKEYKAQIKKMSTKFSAVLKNKKDTSVMIFTSSTAGTPVAGIMIPHYGLVQQDFTARYVLGLKKEDHYWCTAHPGWVTGTIYGILAPLSVGCTNYVLESHFDARDWIRFMKKNKISVIYTAPTALKMLKSDLKKTDLEGRKIYSVGEALTTGLFDIYKKLGVEINDTYWQTETGAIVIANRPGMRKKPGSMGKAIPGIKAKITDGVITLVPDWPAMMTSVFRHKKMYRDYFKKRLFFTNDLARRDKDGYFFFEARKDDIIKTSGERVSPVEIEGALLKNKSVKEAAVIGIPDEIRGSVLKAFIVLEKDVVASDKLKEELSMFVKNNYAGHAYPKQIEFVKSLPKTNSGKIIRAQLRKH